jgi:hypothetical protein
LAEDRNLVCDKPKKLKFVDIEFDHMMYSECKKFDTQDIDLIHIVRGDTPHYILV